MARLVIQAWLRTQGIGNVEIRRQPGLQTRNLASFQGAMADLVKCCAEEVAPCNQPPHQRVIFNLSGGFKSETGFLQLLGMFYADEIVYQFERSAELMRIPRLNIEMTDEEAVYGDLRDFRRAAMKLPVTNPKSGVHWFGMDGQYTLTAWGELVWSSLQEGIYAKEIFDPPSDLIKFGPKFVESCQERLVDINRKIDHLARHLETPREPSHRGGLDFKLLQGGGHPRIPEATHELDAWHGGKAKRIYCRMEGKTIVLLKLDEGLH